MINAGVFVILLTCEAAAFFYQAACGDHTPRSQDDDLCEEVRGEAMSHWSPEEWAVLIIIAALTLGACMLLAQLQGIGP